jgi:TldD protein
LKDILGKTINTATDKHQAQYAETRALELSLTTLTLKEGRVEAAKQGIEKGVAIRVLVNGSWGFASVGSFNPETLTQAITDACKMAKTASAKLKTPIKLAQTKPIQDKAVLKPRKDPSTIPVEEKIRNASTLNNTILEHDKRIKTCSISYLDLTGKTTFMNNNGTYIEQDKLYVWTYVTATAKQSDTFTFSREEIGSTAGYEVFDTETPETVGKRTAERAIKQLEAKPPKGGKYPVILGTNVIGVFAHEAFGHLAEADLTLAGSIIADKIGKQIASPHVTLYDDGTIQGAFGSYRYDDEGIPAQKTLLIKDGFVAGLMHNLETAHKFNTQPTGNARAEDYKVDPIIRMRNTYIQPKDHTFQELIEPIKFGYYLKAFRGGQANIDGTFQVGIQEAYQITKGEIGEPILNASISGNTLETLHKIDAVGKDFQLWPGRCGKGQEAFTCDGGPHVRMKEVLIGGNA